MRFNLFYCLALALSAVQAFGSTVSTLSTTTVTGTTYTVSVTDFTTTGADMAGIIITANFTAGAPLVCTWTVAGTCTSAGSEFSVSYPASLSTHPQASNNNWTVTNSRSGFTLARANGF